MYDTAVSDGTNIRIDLPFALLAITPALQGICVWGQRGGCVEPYIEWLLQRRSPQPHRPIRPVRLPANATPASVAIASASGPAETASGAGGKPLTQRPTGLLQRARGGVLIIESADLVPRATAAALMRSLGGMPPNERPLLIARSEQHPSEWSLIADQCAFWVREPAPGKPFAAPFDTSTGSAVAMSPQDVVAAVARRRELHLTTDVVQQIIRRSDQYGNGPLHNVHGIDLFVARTAKTLAALRNSPEVTADHIELAWQLVATHRLPDLTEARPPTPDAGQRAPSDDDRVSDVNTPSVTDATGAAGAAATTGGGSPGPQSDSDSATDAATASTSPSPDGSAGHDTSRVIVVPPAALFGALALPAADGHRPPRRLRARLGATGTPVGTTVGYLPGHPLALGATLQAALPWQQLRKPDLRRPGRSPATAIQIRPEDLRSHRRRPRPKVLYIIAVDGSGSMAQGRMQLAKGAALAVLAGAYKERRFVSLVDFRGTDATLVSPPGRSSAQIRRLITAMPSGGGTPLPAALALARDVARRWLHANPTGRVHVIMFTDGKANVPLQPKANRPAAKYNSASAEEYSARSASRRAAARRDIIGLGEQLSTMPVTISLVDNHSWRPTPELHDLAHILDASLVRVSHRFPRGRGVGRAGGQPRL